MTSHPLPEGAVAIIGMAGRFPGADNIGEFWRNVRAGVSSITRWKRRSGLFSASPGAPHSSASGQARA